MHKVFYFVHQTCHLPLLVNGAMGRVERRRGSNVEPVCLEIQNSLCIKLPHFSFSKWSGDVGFLEIYEAFVM